ncbi:MAG: hypothetical protein V8R82_01820 [Clostridia bacterium]
MLKATNSTAATAFWGKSKANYCFENSVQFVLNGKDGSKRRVLGATSSANECGDGPCGIGGCGESGCDNY